MPHQSMCFYSNPHPILPPVMQDIQSALNRFFGSTPGVQVVSQSLTITKDPSNQFVAGLCLIYILHNQQVGGE
jgi:hypothetical protein